MRRQWLIILMTSTMIFLFSGQYMKDVRQESIHVDVLWAINECTRLFIVCDENLLEKFAERVSIICESHDDEEAVRKEIFNSVFITGEKK